MEIFADIKNAGIKKLVESNVAASRFRVTTTERIDPSPGGPPVPTPPPPPPPPRENQVPTTGPYVGGASPWDFSETSREQRERELGRVMAFSGPAGGVAEQTPRRGVGAGAGREPPPEEEPIYFTAEAWELALALGLDPERLDVWPLSEIEPSGCNGNFLVKDVKRAVAIKDAEQERQRRTEQLAEQERQTRARLEAGSGGLVDQLPGTNGDEASRKTGEEQLESLLEKKYGGLADELTTTTDIESW